jgi:glycosyltransferase involved in cell wall biosynthesis
MMNVLVDGWPLTRLPNSPQALYTLALLAHPPQGVKYILASPQEPDVSTTEGVEVAVEQVGESAWDRLVWQQRELNRLGQRVKADLMHLVGPTPPLMRKVPVMIGSSGYGLELQRKGNVGQRLMYAMARGGMQRGQTLLVPPHWPAGKRAGKPIEVMPFIHPIFLEEYTGTKPDLPERFVLYHGPSGEADMLALMDAWSWVVGSMGDLVELLLVDVSESGAEWLNSFLERHQLKIPHQVLPRLSLQAMAVLYQHADALLYPGKPRPWGSPVVHAVSCGVPVVGYETPELDALIGPAGITVEERDARKLGASILTVLVNDDVREELSQEAINKRDTWLQQDIRSRLGEIYQEVVSGKSN